MEVRNLRLKIHLEVRPNRADDVDITVMYTKMEIEAMNLGCIYKGEIREGEGGWSQNWGDRIILSN